MRKRIKNKLNKLTQEQFLATRSKIIEQKASHSKAAARAKQLKLEGLPPVRTWLAEKSVRLENIPVPPTKPPQK